MSSLGDIADGRISIFLVFVDPSSNCSLPIRGIVVHVGRERHVEVFADGKLRCNYNVLFQFGKFLIVVKYGEDTDNVCAQDCAGRFSCSPTTAPNFAIRCPIAETCSLCRSFQIVNIYRGCCFTRYVMLEAFGCPGSVPSDNFFLHSLWTFKISCLFDSDTVLFYDYEFKILRK